MRPLSFNFRAKQGRYVSKALLWSVVQKCSLLMRGGGLILAAALVRFKRKLVLALKTSQAASQLLRDRKELLTKFDQVKWFKKFGLALTVCYFFLRVQLKSINIRMVNLFNSRFLYCNTKFSLCTTKQ